MASASFLGHLVATSEDEKKVFKKENIFYLRKNDGFPLCLLGSSFYDSSYTGIALNATRDQNWSFLRMGEVNLHFQLLSR